MNTYAIDVLLPQNFNPFQNQGVQQKQCNDREVCFLKIVIQSYNSLKYFRKLLIN